MVRDVREVVVISMLSILILIHTYIFVDSELYKKRLLRRILEIESELMKIRGNMEEGK